MKHLLRRRMTLRYPESKMELPPGYRYPQAGYKGRHILEMEKCTGCSICEYMCRNITGAIGMVPVEGTFPRNRKAIFPQIDYGMCVFCGFCVDVCVFSALNMTQDYELSSYDKQQLIYTPQQLATPPGVSGRARFVVTRGGAYHKE
jgi:NADH-quinone oxidoreductase subunit I